MSQAIKRTIILLIVFLLLLAWWTSITIGLSWDEYFHHINGLVRYEFLASLGEVQKFEFRNNKFYPGLYDTLSYGFGQIIFFINKKFYINNIDVVIHIFNIFFSSLSILGLYLLTQRLFNKKIALIASLLTLLNPFFFGHMGMNSKDIVVFFSFIWFCYYFYQYCTENNKVFKNLILASLFIGFGCGVRLTFLIIIFPVVIIGITYLFIKFKTDYFNLTKRLSLHIPIAFFITVCLIIFCWPHFIVEVNKGNFVEFLSLVIKNTINWLDGPKIGLINGEFYEVFNTPKSYFLDIIIYRIPFYFTFLLIATYSLIFLKKINIVEEENFKQKFILINIIAFFPILLALLLNVNVYDNLRLFLFIIPIFCIIAAISLDYFFETFKSSIKVKAVTIFVFLLFSLSFYRFVLLTPYQYTYVNYSYLNFEDSKGKFEHDYWGASYKELVKKIKKKYNKEEIKDFKIADCGGGDYTLIYYLNKYLGIKKTYSGTDVLDQATHVVMNNRVFLDVFKNEHVKELVNQKDASFKIKDMEKVTRAPNIRQTCFNYKHFSGKDVVTVSRDGLPLTIFRELDK